MRKYDTRSDSPNYIDGVTAPFVAVDGCIKALLDFPNTWISIFDYRAPSKRSKPKPPKPLGAYKGSGTFLGMQRPETYRTFWDFVRDLPAIALEYRGDKRPQHPPPNRRKPTSNLISDCIVAAFMCIDKALDDLTMTR